MRVKYFNPRSPCGERQVWCFVFGCVLCISIHAPRVGSDARFFSIQYSAGIFQSTLPVWGATPSRYGSVQHVRISIHAPRVGSDMICCSTLITADCISIHAPRVGSDQLILFAPSRNTGFQSTLPVWGATDHATAVLGQRCDFNPRSPCGERRTHDTVGGCGTIFQSTLPVWGATWTVGKIYEYKDDFNPRSPCGERRKKLLESYAMSGISIHAPRVGSDHAQLTTDADGNWISIHAPRVGSDQSAYKYLLLVR